MGGYRFPDHWPSGKARVGLPKDNEIAVARSALEKCDLWHDPGLFGAFFISGPLEAALKEARVTRTLRRHRCVVVNDE